MDNCGGNILNWTQPEPGLDYEIFLGSALYARVSGTGFAYLYTDTGTNTWTVVAVDAAGNRSAPSNPATVTRDGGRRALLSRPGRLVAWWSWRPPHHFAHPAYMS